MTTLDPGRTTTRLRALVEAETPSADAGLLAEAYDLVRGWGAEALGRPGECLEVDGVPHLRWAATSDQPHVLLVTHADTVWPRGTTSRRPFAIEDGRATGPGVFDMKAGIVIAMDALGLVEDTSRVSLVVTGDEEIGSTTSRGLIEAAARGAIAALVLEPSIDGALKIARNGASFYELDFHGRSAHAGLEPEAGRNALVELSRVVMSCADLEDRGCGTTVTPTLAKAGTTNNVVPDRAVLTVDARARTIDELERVDRQIRTLGSGDSGVAIEVDGGINRPPLETSASSWLAGMAEQVARERGLPAPGGRAVGGGSDGNFTAALGVPTLDGLGPIGAGAHAEHEWADVDSLGQRAELVVGLIERLNAGE